MPINANPVSNTIFLYCREAYTLDRSITNFSGYRMWDERGMRGIYIL
jgi:hypothetical protein